MRCDRYRRHVQAMARDEGPVNGRLQRHVGSCLRCQAEMARERRLYRQLKAIRREPRTPQGLLERILATVEATGTTPTARSHNQRAAGVVAGAGALAGVLAVGLGTRAGRRMLRLAG